ncbi:MAG: response regulator [Spirochaetales bacterium]|nr:response regulator [Spirochaetales bacterium]
MESGLILIIEDDEPIRRLLRVHLKDVGWNCEETSRGDSGLALAASLKPDVILLDLGLPDADGTLLIPQFKAISASALIVISARDQETEKVRALDAGADDYVTKPLGLAELKARIKASLRRVTPSSTEPQKTFDDLVLDISARRVFLADNEIHVTALEWKLLLVMTRYPGKILTTAFLLKEVWGQESLEQRHYVKILMAGLRKKLERHPTHTQFIHTEVGVGYRFYE